MSLKRFHTQQGEMLQSQPKRIYECKWDACDLTGRVLTFVSVQVLARRKEGSGKVKVLLHWTPEDM